MCTILAVLTCVCAWKPTWLIKLKFGLGNKHMLKKTYEKLVESKTNTFNRLVRSIIQYFSWKLLFKYHLQRDQLSQTPTPKPTLSNYNKNIFIKNQIQILFLWPIWVSICVTCSWLLIVLLKSNTKHVQLWLRCPILSNYLPIKSQKKKNRLIC